MYGDSITWLLSSRNRSTWDKHFGSLKAEPLGVSGDTVEKLVWRLMEGKERPSQDPKVVALLIGINNRGTDPSPKLDFLVGWLRAAMPSTRIIVIALLPTIKRGPKLASINATYKSIAEKHGVRFSTCGQNIDPKNPSLLHDGLHPAANGYDILLTCLKRDVDQELQK